MKDIFKKSRKALITKYINENEVIEKNNENEIIGEYKSKSKLPPQLKPLRL